MKELYSVLPKITREDGLIIKKYANDVLFTKVKSVEEKLNKIRVSLELGEEDEKKHNNVKECSYDIKNDEFNFVLEDENNVLRHFFMPPGSYVRDFNSFLREDDKKKEEIKEVIKHFNIRCEEGEEEEKNLDYLANLLQSKNFRDKLIGYITRIDENILSDEYLNTERALKNSGLPNVNSRQELEVREEIQEKAIDALKERCKTSKELKGVRVEIQNSLRISESRSPVQDIDTILTDSDSLKPGSDLHDVKLIAIRLGEIEKEFKKGKNRIRFDVVKLDIHSFFVLNIKGNDGKIKTIFFESAPLGNAGAIFSFKKEAAFNVYAKQNPDVSTWIGPNGYQRDESSCFIFATELMELFLNRIEKEGEDKFIKYIEKFQGEIPENEKTEGEVRKFTGIPPEVATLSHVDLFKSGENDDSRTFLEKHANDSFMLEK
ncbi:MAG: hypothetical protein LBB09_02385, partial [Rickettsiales bacterium]|nr:hypothetical protein [Rickettsiales bacterium]